jgi:mono/diheme cytochrome c family protein
MYKSRLYLVAIALLGTGGLWAQVARPRTSVQSSDGAVTAVSGESWLIHLNRSFNDSSMGRTGRVGPAPVPGEDMAPALSSVSLPSTAGNVRLRGADLYRLNCRGCHGESGLGAPPEINSVINPVRATSVDLIMERMKINGMAISRAEAGKLAQQSNAAILQRLHQGGESMPPFSHLGEAEIRSLLAYLRELADLPGAKNGQTEVTESHVRVGELIVKSTCHTCHSAVGPDPGTQEMLNGAIPPLSALTQRKREPEFIGKVTQGAPVLMGTPALLCRGRMPVFFYLSEEEAADVYLYLTLYPPKEPTNVTPVMASMQSAQPPSGNGTGSPEASLVANAKPSGNREATTIADVRMEGLPWWTAAVATVLLAGGLVFTLREFRRLSAKSAARKAPAREPRRKPELGWQLRVMDRASLRPEGLPNGPSPAPPGSDLTGT